MEHHATERRRRLPRRVGIVAVVAVAVAGLLLFVAFGPPGIAEADLKLEDGSISADNNTSAFSNTSHGSHARLQVQRIGVINQSSHPLMQRVTALIVDHLAAMPVVKHVVQLDAPPFRLDVGEQLPDVFVVLDMPQHAESGSAPLGREFKATVTADAGPRPWRADSSTIDHLTPPVVKFHLGVRVDHTSTATGDESREGRMAAANIAAQVAEKLAESLTKWSNEFGVMPELPAAFYGSVTEPAADWPLPDSPDVQRVYSGPRLMVHNETLWTLPSAEPTRAMRAFHEQVAAAGWRVNQKLDEGSRAPYFRATYGDDVVEAFVPQQRTHEPDAQTQRIVIVVQRRFSRADMSNAVQQLFDAGAPLPHLVMFESHMDKEQRQAMAKRVVDEGSTQPELLLFLARQQKAAGESEAAIAALNRAALFAMGDDDASGLRRRIETAGRDITGDKEWEPAEPDEAMLRDAGFILLPASGEAAVEVALSEPANYYDPRGKLTWHRVEVTPTRIPEGVYTLVHRSAAVGSGGSSASHSTTHNPSRPWRSSTSLSSDGGAWHVNAMETGEDRFRVTLTRREQ